MIVENSVYQEAFLSAKHLEINQKLRVISRVTACAVLLSITTVFVDSIYLIRHFSKPEIQMKGAVNVQGLSTEKKGIEVNY